MRGLFDGQRLLGSNAPLAVPILWSGRRLQAEGANQIQGGVAQAHPVQRRPQVDHVPLTLTPGVKALIRVQRNVHAEGAAITFSRRRAHCETSSTARSEPGPEVGRAFLPDDFPVGLESPTYTKGSGFKPCFGTLIIQHHGRKTASLTESGSSITGILAPIGSVR